MHLSGQVYQFYWTRLNLNQYTQGPSLQVLLLQFEFREASALNLCCFIGLFSNFIDFSSKPGLQNFLTPVQSIVCLHSSPFLSFLFSIFVILHSKCLFFLRFCLEAEPRTTCVFNWIYWVQTSLNFISSDLKEGIRMGSLTGGLFSKNLFTLMVLHIWLAWCF